MIIVWSGCYFASSAYSLPNPPTLLAPGDRERISSQDTSRPPFIWTQVNGATEYEVILNNNAVYKGTDNRYVPQTDLPPNQYTWYVKAYGEDWMVESRSAIFTIFEAAEVDYGTRETNLEFLQVIYPKHGDRLHEEKVNFQWESLRDADTYELYLDGQPIYYGPDTSFFYDQPLSFADHEWQVIGLTPTTELKSRIIKFRLIELPQPTLVSPEDEAVLESGPDRTILLEWEPIMDTEDLRSYEEPADDIQYEVWVNNIKQTETEDYYYYFRVDADAVAYRKIDWYIIAKTDTMQEKSEEWEIFLDIPEYMVATEESEERLFAIGVKAGANFSTTLGEMPNDFGTAAVAFACFEYHFNRFLDFELDLGYRMTTLPIEGGKGFLIEDTRLIHHSIPLTLLAKPFWRISGFQQLRLYGLIGIEIGVKVRLIIENSSTEQNFDFNYPSSAVNFSFKAGLGLGFSYDILEFFLEGRVGISVTDDIGKTQSLGAGKFLPIEVILGANLYRF